jgi:hypothetical protein
MCVCDGMLQCFQLQKDKGCVLLRADHVSEISICMAPHVLSFFRFV